ncbi:succinate dehydrogenase, putative [Perkinsus marinus ATCC 50983]|uniref:Succinate dehydrogenase, putative n=1 Tax=Perkinsus marinus (strain ATCC 50983 / TXsc) TaxID=423536 RepID=C5M121_PERM5|nr:succinate dehydrogenase, putative [Perkinsus marinus ATCC 50983]EEQ97251.1 succinate dehydrogenase, putative [Perkinsus marinus ATCC 50983]|eukprot:XP_002764534.1 succinate dehydrogenase, putative [Perkinsus marinus ATCC 50983]
MLYPKGLQSQGWDFFFFFWLMDSSESSRAPTRVPRSRTVAVEASRATPTRPPPRKAPPTCIVAHNKPDRLVTYRRGQLVQAFISQIPENDYDPDIGWMKVGSRVEGQVSPRLGMTDGWVDATIVDDFDKSQYQAELRETWPVVEYTHTLWGDGRGAMLDGNKAYNLRQSMRMEHIRLATSERRTPSLSLLIVRYGDGNRRVDTRFDMAVTDELITDLMRDGIYATYGTDYECWCAFIRHTSDLPRISEAWARSTLTRSGCKNLAAMYFLWGAVHGDHKPGYVEYSSLFDLMQRMESVGIPTRWPNPVSLYRVLSSKSWQAALATNTALRIPPTTTIQRADFVQDPTGTCRNAVRALEMQSDVLWSNTRALSVYSEKGVVKIGYSWMAEGVKSFYGIIDLEKKARALWESLPNRESTLMVQHRIDDIVTEPRVFVFNGKHRALYDLIFWWRKRNRGAPLLLEELEDGRDLLWRKVLDVTEFLGVHPGGEKSIMNFAGKDASKMFNMIHSPDLEDGSRVTIVDFSAVGDMGSPKGILMSEVAKHCTDEDCYIVVNGEVIDVSSFLCVHPGGKECIMNFAGRDASEKYNLVHPKGYVAKYVPELVLGQKRTYFDEGLGNGHNWRDTIDILVGSFTAISTGTSISIEFL